MKGILMYETQTNIVGVQGYCVGQSRFESKYGDSIQQLADDYLPDEMMRL
jgi:hypothetical protein